MDPERLRALLKAHPAVTIPAFGTRRDVVCVRVADLRRLVDGDVPDEPLDAAVAALGGERVRLVDPASEAAGSSARGRPRGGGRRGGARTDRPRRSGPALPELDVYELPAAALSED